MVFRVRVLSASIAFIITSKWTTVGYCPYGKKQVFCEEYIWDSDASLSLSFFPLSPLMAHWGILAQLFKITNKVILESSPTVGFCNWIRDIAKTSCLFSPEMQSTLTCRHISTCMYWLSSKLGAQLTDHREWSLFNIQFKTTRSENPR